MANKTSVKAKIELTIKDIEGVNFTVEITLEEARELRDQLNELVGVEPVWTTPFVPQYPNDDWNKKTVPPYEITTTWCATPAGQKESGSTGDVCDCQSIQ